MNNFNYLIKYSTQSKVIKNRSTKLHKNPQKKGVCLKVYSIKPKKPNSANRKISKIRITSNNFVILSKIPGEAHNLQVHSTVLVKGGRSRDLIGVRYTTVRGKYDLLGVKNRKKSRSLYGVKRINK
jgi:small subunit ribosomal protein S12